MPKGSIAIIPFLAITYSLGLFGQHITGVVPYWEIAWDSNLWESFLPILNIDWPYWLEHIAPQIAMSLNGLGIGLSLLFITAFFLPSTWRFSHKVGKFASGSLTTFLLIWFLWEWKDHAYAWPNLVENSLRIAMPWLLFRWHWKKCIDPFSKKVALLAITLTFLGHGWYALGLAPTPGEFLYMTTRTFGINEMQALVFLKIVGVLDMLVAVGIWIKPAYKPVLIYAAIWGILTAVARITGHFYLDFPLNSLIEWTPEMLVRLGHGLVPGILLMYNVKGNV